VEPARERAARLKDECSEEENYSAIAMELNDGKIITGRSSRLMHATAAVILNAVKYLANISDGIYLISPIVLEPILNLKSKTLHGENISLNSEEILIALSICAATNPTAQVALEKIAMLKGCQAHSTTILSGNDDDVLRRLGIDVTSDPEYQSESLYYNC